MTSVEIVLTLIGLAISAGVLRLLVVAGYNQKTLEQNSSDIKKIMTNHIPHLEALFKDHCDTESKDRSRIKEDISFIKGKLSKNGIK